MKNYINFILEKKVNKLDPDVIYNEYYSDIDKNIFYHIIGTDPTSYIRGKLYVGTYSKWLLKLFKDNKLQLEDLDKVSKYLKTYKKFRQKFKNLNDIADINELFIEVKDFIEKDFDIPEEENHLVGEFEEVFRNDKYRIIVPKTLKASQYFGKNSNWCTTSLNQFNNYTKNGNKLFILYTDITKDNLQFSFYFKMFMDINDDSIDIYEFFDDNPDILEFFRGQDMIIYIRIYHNTLVLEEDKKNVRKLKGKKLRDYLDFAENELSKDDFILLYLKIFEPENYILFTDEVHPGIVRIKKKNIKNLSNEEKERFNELFESPSNFLLIELFEPEKFELYRNAIKLKYTLPPVCTLDIDKHIEDVFKLDFDIKYKYIEFILDEIYDFRTNDEEDKKINHSILTFLKKYFKRDTKVKREFEKKILKTENNKYTKYTKYDTIFEKINNEK